MDRLNDAYAHFSAGRLEEAAMFDLVKTFGTFAVNVAWHCIVIEYNPDMLNRPIRIEKSSSHNFGILFLSCPNHSA